MAKEKVVAEAFEALGLRIGVGRRPSMIKELLCRGGFRHRWPLAPQGQLFKFALTLDELKDLTGVVVQYAINEIYARYGATFPTHPILSLFLTPSNTFRSPRPADLG